MNKEILSIIRNLQNTLSGQPWFGRAVYPILEEVEVSKVYTKPACPAGTPGNSDHSLIELLYHMITWADFTLKRIKNEKKYDPATEEKMNWRDINPKVHTWKKGLAEYKAIHKKIIALLKKKDDSFLKEKADYRRYNYRFLLNGLIQHNIYHLGQIAYLKKLLA